MCVGVVPVISQAGSRASFVISYAGRYMCVTCSP